MIRWFRQREHASVRVLSSRRAPRCFWSQGHIDIPHPYNQPTHPSQLNAAYLHQLSDQYFPLKMEGPGSDALFDQCVFSVVPSRELTEDYALKASLYIPKNDVASDPTNHLL